MTWEETEAQIAPLNAAVRAGQAALRRGADEFGTALDAAKAEIRAEVARASAYLRQQVDYAEHDALPEALRQLLVAAGASAVKTILGPDLAAQIAHGERDIATLLGAVQGPLDALFAHAVPRGTVAAARGAVLAGALCELLRQQLPAAAAPTDPA